MKYLSGIHALNLNCDLDTCGDWHQSAIQWEKLRLYESEGSLWGDYGIEHDKPIPEHTELYNTASSVRTNTMCLTFTKEISVIAVQKTTTPAEALPGFVSV